MPQERCEVVAGGELNPALIGDNRPDYVNTLTRPNRVSAAASRERLELLNDSGALDAGMDIAETVGAANTLEKMLSHQMAVAHRAAMKLGKHVDSAIQRMNAIDANARDRATIEISRLTGPMTRAMLSFQSGAMTLERLRSGGKQTHVVQYVTIKDGGQAMVTGKMSPPGRSRRKRGENQRMANAPHNPLEAARNAKRCGAHSRNSGQPCKQPAMKNGRCRFHGGLSTGPKTPAGLERSRKARWKHGHFSAEARNERRQIREDLRLCRDLLRSIGF